MIRYRSQKQLSLAEFDWPFQTALDGNNRWIKLSECIPWDELAEGYYQGLADTQGRPTKDACASRQADLGCHRSATGDLILDRPEPAEREAREFSERIIDELYPQRQTGRRNPEPIMKRHESVPCYCKTETSVRQSTASWNQAAVAVSASQPGTHRRFAGTLARGFTIAIAPVAIVPLLGDPAYGTRKNRSYLKGHGTRFAGKPLGRPKKVTEANREELKRLKAQRREDYLQRIPIEGKFGQGKNGYRLSYIRAKRADTSFAWINSIFLVMNFLILLRIFFVLCKGGVAAVVLSLLPVGQTLLRHRDTRPVIDGIFGQSVVVR